MLTGMSYSVVSGVLIYLITLLFICSEAPLQEDNLSFYLDSTANCRGTFDLSKRRAYIFGTGSRESSKTITDCYLTLKSETDVIASKTTLQIEVITLKIYDSDVTLTIYDGGREQLVIDSYNVHKGKNRDKLFSTGNRVQFVLKRREVETSENQYDIELIVTPLYTGRDPDPGIPGAGGGDETLRFEKRIPTEAILGIIGGLLIVTVLVIVIVSVLCYRRHRGDDKPWQEHKLAYVNTVASEEPKTTRLWASQNSREYRRGESYDDYARRPTPPSYEDSVFDDAETLPRKRPVYHEYDKRSGNDYHSNRQARDKPRSSEFRARDDSFVQADDDHPQDMYRDKVIRPRVKTAPRRWVVENEDEEVDEEEQPQRRNHWAEAGSADEEEEETVEQREQPEEEEEDTEESEAEASEEEDEPQPPRNQKAPSNGNPVPPPQNAQTMAHPQQFVPQGRLPPVQIPPTMMMRAPAPQFLVYPVPVGPNQFQPVNPGGPPPQEHHTKPSSPKMKSRDPPTYSHLVQRGYNPQEGRDSQAGRSTPRSQGSDNRLHKSTDLEMSEPSLTSGVELMRR